VVIGGLFTSTLLTLVLVPVLYSLTARFTGPRSTRDLDELLDSAEDRRFRPLGLRGQLAAAVATHDVSLTIEPQPGQPGDRRVLEVLADNGLEVTPIAGSAKMLITIPAVPGESEAAAVKVALEQVRTLVPASGYVLSHNGDPATQTNLANG